MRYHYGASLCISSQVGCKMGCRFCASTLSGKVRDLTPGEMVQQIYLAEQDTREKITHVVVMGCGEPFDNYEALCTFLSLIHDPTGHGMSLRNITVSTCGLVDRIRDFAQLDLGVTLAVSLHAPNDEIRKKLMPIAHKVPMDLLLQACREYTEITHRRVTFEYALAQASMMRRFTRRTGRSIVGHAVSCQSDSRESGDGTGSCSVAGCEGAGLPKGAAETAYPGDTSKRAGKGY